MANIDAKTVMALRQRTGAPMMDCKKALQEADGNSDKAVEILRKKGLQTADNKASREAEEGRIFSYVHHNMKLGVMVEMSCETDFVAKNEDFVAFGNGLCLHITAMNPKFLRPEEIDEATIAKEKAFLIEQAKEQMAGRPDEVIEKAVEGRLKKYLAEQCLVEQPFVKAEDGKTTVEETRKALVGKIGENIQIRRFVRLELGS
ncbi:MAG: translation elongation factor Ts [Planctomycetota bacterium]